MYKHDKRSWTVRKNVGTADKPRYIWRKFDFIKTENGWEHNGEDYISVVRVPNSVRPFIITLHKYRQHPIMDTIVEEEYTESCFTIQWGLQRFADDGLLDLTK